MIIRYLCHVDRYWLVFNNIFQNISKSTRYGNDRIASMLLPLTKCQMQMAKCRLTAKSKREAIDSKNLIFASRPYIHVINIIISRVLSNTRRS